MKHSQTPRWPRAFVLLGLLGAGVPAAAEISAEPGTGALLYRAGDGEPVRALSLETEVRIAVTGVAARVSVRQSFRNDSPDWVEGMYVFPLPDDSAVDIMTMRIGERVIVGEVRERAEARRGFEAAAASGRRASLVEQARPNLFTTSVTNVAPGETVEVEIGYQQTVAYDGEAFELRFPLTATPRYATGEADEPDETPSPGLSLREPGPAAPAAVVSLALDPGVALAFLESPSHEVEALLEGGVHVVELETPMDRDFVLRWSPALHGAPSAAAFGEALGSDRYALFVVFPPASDHLPGGDSLGVAQELILVVDTSGSMAGPPLEQARSALLTALALLRPGDWFNVVQFNSTTSALFPEPRPYGAPAVAAARAYVERLRAEGGTEMAPALAFALDDPPPAGRLRQVVFVTDGAVDNEGGLFRLITERLGAARLFTIGIGPAPNAYFMRKAAEFGRGTFTYIGRIEAVEARMEALFAKLDRPALTDLAIEWPRGVDAEPWPNPLPDLYAGEPVVFAARLADLGPGPLAIALTGKLGSEAWSHHLEVPASAGRPIGVAKLWARRRIESLMDERATGAPAEAIRDEVLGLALEHGIVTRFTSLVAVDRTPARSRAAALARSDVANLRPGATGPTTGFPGTATNGPLEVQLGLGALLLALFGIGVARLDRRASPGR